MAVASKPTNIDYVNTYFQIPILTPIRGEPTFETLRVLRDEIKANSGDVATILGGGNFGYLGLVLSPAEYARVSPETPFVRPTNPPPLVIPQNTTQHAATRMREDHTEELRQFRECEDVEAALKKQIVAAIEDKYTKFYRNRYTQRVQGTVAAFLTSALWFHFATTIISV